MVGAQAFVWLEKQIAPSHHSAPSQQIAPSQQTPGAQEQPRPQLQQRTRQPPPPSDHLEEEFTVQPVGGDFSAWASVTDPQADMNPATSRPPPPEHVRKSDKLDEKSMSDLLRQLDEERKHGVPLSLSEQKAQHAAMQDRYV